MITAEPSRSDTGIRLVDLVAAFSLATDLGLGQPMEHALRSWLIASRLAARMGLDADARHDLFYVVTLAWVGCVADTPEVARWFGDDIAYRRDSFGVDRAGLPMMAYSLRRVGVGTPARAPPSPGSHARRNGGRGDRPGLHVALHLDRADGSSASGSATRSPRSSRQVFTRWDGKGVPAGIGGDQIAPTVRLFHVADSVEVIHRTQGLDAAVDLARAWRGTQFAPDVVDAFVAAARRGPCRARRCRGLGRRRSRTSRACRHA